MMKYIFHLLCDIYFMHRLSWNICHGIHVPSLTCFFFYEYFSVKEYMLHLLYTDCHGEYFKNIFLSNNIYSIFYAYNVMEHLLCSKQDIMKTLCRSICLKHDIVQTLCRSMCSKQNLNISYYNINTMTTTKTL